MESENVSRWGWSDCDLVGVARPHGLGDSSGDVSVVTKEQSGRFFVRCALVTGAGVGFLYLAMVIDLWSRKVVGWSMRSDLTTPLVTDALDMAISQRKTQRSDFPLGQGQPI